MYDLLIKNGTLMDGTGADARSADIGIINGRIAAIGDLQNEQAGQVLDAAGKVVVPGFIDMHSHADNIILGYPQMESMLHQGITTFVGCQCGHSIAPVGGRWEGSQALFHLMDKASDKLFPDMYNKDYYADTAKILPLVEDEFGFSPTWKTMGDFLDEVDKKGLSGNMIVLSGYNTLRLLESEPDYPRPLTCREKDKIKGHIREAMDAGAFGLSTGLDYAPGAFCGTEELVEMAAELKPYDGIYFSHWRKTGLRAGTPKKQKKIEGIKEAMEIGRRNGVQVEISHLSNGFDIFPSRDDYMHVAAAERTLQIIDEYAASGLRVNFDVIPNITGGTILMSDLAAYFRPWVLYANGLSLFIRNLRHPDYRRQISDYIYAGKYFTINPNAQPDWDEWMSVIQSRNSGYMGKSIHEIALEKNISSLNACFDLMMEEPDIKIFMASHSMNIHAVRTYLRHPLATVGNDTFVFDLTGSLHYDPEFPRAKPNPNTYCGFIKYLTELGMPRMEDSIQKMSGKAAEILGLTDRGFLKEGYRADIVVLDLRNLATNENYVEPRTYPSGVEHVLVNGEFVLKDGTHTGKRPGGTIRRQTR